MLLKVIRFPCNLRSYYNHGIYVGEMKYIRQKQSSKLFISGIISSILKTRSSSLKKRKINEEEFTAHSSLVR